MLQKQKNANLNFLISFSLLLFCTWGYAETVASKSPSSADSSKETSAEQTTTRDPSSLLQSETNIASEGMAPAEAPSKLWAPEWRAQWGEKGIDWEAFVFWNGFSN